MPVTFGSLFAGIGGFDLGFERAGMACRWQVEIDNYASKVLAKHWPAVHRERDIRQCGQHNLEPVDVICGGFPCQDISYAGLGAGLEGERSGLFFEAVRVVRELRPKAVVLENVAALLTRGLDAVLGTLAAIGYDAEWHCIPAAAVGAPHIRDRVFVLAYCQNNGQQQGQPNDTRSHERICEGQKRGSWSCCEIVADSDGNNKQRGRSTVQIWRQWITEETEVNGEQRRTKWEIEPAVGRVADGVPYRVDRLRGLGNAVVPQVAEFVARIVLEKIQ